MINLSSRLKHIDSSEFREVFTRLQNLKNPVDLSVGVPEELTPQHIKQAGIKAIKENKTVYTTTNGIEELRQALVKKLVRENSIDCDEKQITVVPGLTTGQLMLYMAILDPGDEIVVLEPCYPPYTHLAKMLGAKVISLSTFPSFQPDISTLRSLVTDKTKAIVLNSPNNPTGAVYPEQTLRKIANIAKKHDVLIISDEIYEHFTYDQSHFSVGSIYQNTITLNGFSKGYAMTGWRLGYLTGPLPIIDAINELLQYAVFSSSSIAQHAAIQALNHTPDIKDKYRKKRKLVVKALEGMGYQIHGAQGAYYFFLKTPHGMDDIEFVNLAVSNNLVIVPGRAFCDESTYFRISYGADLETLHKGLKILARISS